MIYLFALGSKEDQRAQIWPNLTFIIILKSQRAMFLQEMYCFIGYTRAIIIKNELSKLIFRNIKIKRIYYYLPTNKKTAQSGFNSNLLAYTYRYSNIKTYACIKCKMIILCAILLFEFLWQYLRQNSGTLLNFLFWHLLPLFSLLWLFWLLLFQNI